MIKYLAYIVLATMVFTSCKKDLHSSVFDKSSDQRLNDVLTNYQSILVGSPYGWVANVVPNPKDNKDAYAFWFKFNDSNRVSSRWMFRNALNSSYRLKALQQPELIFDTYTYLHMLANAEPQLPGAQTGVGLKSDFEFEIISGSVDSFVLKGKYNGSDVTMFRATAKDTIAIPGYPMVGSGYFQSTSKNTQYKTTVADGTVAGTSEYTMSKAVSISHVAGIMFIDYADLGVSGFQYKITLKNATDTAPEVALEAPDLQQTMTENSFKVLNTSYDPVTGRIYIKTFYTSITGADCVVEETLVRE